MQQREQLTSIHNFGMFDVRFGKARTSKIPDSDRTYDRIPITINYGDAVFGPLLLKTDKCFSFGARQNVDKETGEVYGWTLPISMYDKDKPTADQRLFVQRLEEVIKYAQQRVLDEYPIDEETINKLGGCLWQPDDETRGPTLYAKIISGRNTTRYDSRFSRVKDLARPSKKTTLTKEQMTDSCYVIAVIRVDSIYVCEDKAYLQVKVYEANVQKLEDLPSYL